MGMFYIYSTLDNYKLCNTIDFKNAYIGWEQKEYEPWVEVQVVKEEMVLVDNIYDYILCAEILPNKIILHYGDQFSETIEMPSDIAMEWLFVHGYNKVTNYILKESYACLDYAIGGVARFCMAVAHNKAEQCFLKGIYE